MPAGRALVVIVVALLLGGLLNVTALTEAADRQPPSLKRDISQVLVWPFEQISGLLGLDQPRALLADRLGRDADRVEMTSTSHRASSGPKASR